MRLNAIVQDHLIAPRMVLQEGFRTAEPFSHVVLYGSS